MDINDRLGEFLAIIFRSKSINRWGLMRNLSYETLSEHCFEVSVLSHALSIIGNTKYNKSFNEYKIATAALYHDMSEILTGDLPTPVKYYNAEIKDAYKKIEKTAENILLDLLPLNTKEKYNILFDLNEEEKAIIKTADKICAYIKCLHEISGGNIEFVAAERTIKEQLNEINSPEGKYFIDNYLLAFTKSLDDITLK